MAAPWDREEALERFYRLWAGQARSGVCHTSGAWDQRADRWERELREDPVRQADSARRVGDTVAYLLEQGLLGPEDAVADVGCGPGRFVTAFARHAGHVTGIDLSPRMVEYGAAHAAAEGADNTDFVACDFLRADVAALGWEKRFDLVFSSITPAVSTRPGFEKMERMSRGFCFNSSFIWADDPVGRAAMEAALPGVRLPPLWDGRSFYAMFNVLWLMGRFPLVRYYRERRDETLPVGEELLRRVTERYPAELVTPGVREGVLRWLEARADADGAVRYPSERRYAWILWDVRDRAPRDYSR